MGISLALTIKGSEVYGKYRKEYKEKHYLAGTASFLPDDRLSCIRRGYVHNTRT